jgi:hypothetical protein
VEKRPNPQKAKAKSCGKILGINLAPLDTIEIER